MQRGVVGLTGGNRRPAFDGLETRELRMGTTPTQFLARKCAYYAAPRRLGPHRGLGRPAGRRLFETSSVSRFAHETTHHPRRPGVSPVADDSCRFVARLDAKNGHRRALESERSRILFLSRIASIEEKENGSGLASERRFGTLWGV